MVPISRVRLYDPFFFVYEVKHTIVRQCRVLFKLLNNPFNNLAYDNHLLLIRVDTLNIHEE